MCVCERERERERKREEERERIVFNKCKSALLIITDFLLFQVRLPMGTDESDEFEVILGLYYFIPVVLVSSGLLKDYLLVK